MYLHEERNEAKVMEVELAFVVQGVLIRSRERIRRRELADNGEWRHRDILLVDFEPFRSRQSSENGFSTIRTTPCPRLALSQLESGEHIEHLPDVRVGAFDKFIDHVGGDFHLFPDRSESCSGNEEDDY